MEETTLSWQSKSAIHVRYVLYPTALPTGETTHHILYVKFEFESEVRVRIITVVAGVHI
jgi:hypothetical protein